MTQREAVHYGQVEIIPGIQCDGYVLDDETACLSERGTADLLGMNQMALNRMKTTWPPKTLKPFTDKGWTMKTTFVKVTAKNSPYKGRKIVVYNTDIIETVIRAYVIASGHNALQKNQFHIGERCSVLVCALTRTALEATIKEACGLPTNLQKTAQKHYTDIVELMKESGLKCSVSDEMAIKTDITDFLDIPLSTLNSFLTKHRKTIKPIKLDRETITEESYTSKSSHLDNDPLPVYTEGESFMFTGKRISRGLYRWSKGIINADLNGAIGIIKKVVPEALDLLIEILHAGAGFAPFKIVNTF